MLSEIKQLADASFAGIIVKTAEPKEAEAVIRKLCVGQGWSLGVWDVSDGGRWADGPIDGQGDPLWPITSLRKSVPSGGPDTIPTSVMVAHNFHHYVGQPLVAQAVANQIAVGKATRQLLVLLAPSVSLPPELQRLFVVVDHDLPSVSDLQAIAESLDHPIVDGAVDAARGLTIAEAENAFALSVVTTGRIEPAAVWRVKTDAVAKSGVMTLHTGSESLEQLIGVSALRDFAVRSLTSGTERPRGILLLGPPGTGKSQFAKALGSATRRPTLCLDVGALMGSLVGQSEANLRNALAVADAMAPCVLFVDEIEKALSGTASSGQTDGGTTARMFGTLLAWLNDHTSDVYFVGTCNDVTSLPPEFARAERFDATFFIDLPSADSRAKIWRQYAGVEGPYPASEEWTGAEIKSCCRLSRLLGVPLDHAARCVVPVASSAADKIASLRRWAMRRVVDADTGVVYGAGPSVAVMTRTVNAVRS